MCWMSKSYIHVSVLFHTGLYAYNSIYLVLTYHQSIHWNWHQSGERHGNKKHKVIQCSILMLSSMNHTKHTAIKNSVTMLMSQFHDQNFTKLSSIQSECTPCSQCKGKVKTWCVYELFCVMSVRRGKFWLHYTGSCGAWDVCWTQRNGTHGFRTTLLSTSSLRGSPFLGWQVWP